MEIQVVLQRGKGAWNVLFDTHSDVTFQYTSEGAVLFLSSWNSDVHKDFQPFISYYQFEGVIDVLSVSGLYFYQTALAAVESHDNKGACIIRAESLSDIRNLYKSIEMGVAEASPMSCLFANHEKYYFHHLVNYYKGQNKDLVQANESMYELLATVKTELVSEDCDSAFTASCIAKTLEENKDLYATAKRN